MERISAHDFDIFCLAKNAKKKKSKSLDDMTARRRRRISGEMQILQELKSAKEGRENTQEVFLTEHTKTRGY